MTKYTPEEKRIVHLIEDMNSRLSILRHQYLVLDAKKSAQIAKLKGKYVPRKNVHSSQSAGFIRQAQG